MEAPKGGAKASIDSQPGLVTIAIPVFNGSDFLATAIDSALAQTWPAVEVLVVDDGSTDGGRTGAIARSYGDRIRYISKPNGGVATALNAAIDAMRGEWFSWLSHDDVYHPRKVEVQMEALRDAPPDTLAFGDAQEMDEAGHPLLVRRCTTGFDPERPLWAVLEGRINGCTMMVPRRLLVEAGGFHPGLPTTQDYELWFRLLRRHRLIAVPGAFVSQRMHARQGSRTGRHVEEAGLLWCEMLGALSAEERRHHGGSELAFLFRFWSFLAHSSYGAGKARALSALRDSLGETRVTLVWAATAPAGPAAALDVMRQAGLNKVTPVVADLSRDFMGSLELRASLPPGAILIRLRPDDGLATILAAGLAAGGDIVLLADSTTALTPDGILHGLAAVLAEGRDGWLQDLAEDPGVLPAAFRGAVLKADAVRAALDRHAALGHGGAESALALVARLAHAPGRPGVPLVDPPGGWQAAAQRLDAPGPRPPLAATRPGMWLLDRAIELHRRNPRLARFVRPLLPPAFGTRGLVDTEAYRRGNPDVAASGVDPVLHYLRHGWRERRNPRPGHLPRSHPAFAATALGTWVLGGALRLDRYVPVLRGRIAPAIARVFGARGLVDEAWYRAAYPDVSAAGVDPVLHYLRHGWREGRVPKDEAFAAARRRDAGGERQAGPAWLLVLHTLGGGTSRYVELLAALLRRNGVQPVFAWGIGNRALALSTTGHDHEEMRFQLPAELDTAARRLRRYGIVRADIVHAMGIENHLAAVLDAVGVPYDITFLDYHLFATSPHLLDDSGMTAADGGVQEATAVAPLLRTALPTVIAGAGRRIACSRDLAARLKRLSPDLEVVAVRPPEPSLPESFRVTPPPGLGSSEKLRILLIGHLNTHKGREEVLDVARESRRRGLPLEFHHFGMFDPAVSPQDQLEAGVLLYGYFRHDALATAIGAISPHLAWFPARAPETYGFALSDAMLMGLPILARGLGAYRERLSGRPYTWIVPAGEVSTESWIGRLMALRNSGLMLPADAPDLSDLPPLIDDFYEGAYLEPACHRLVPMRGGA